MQELPRRVASGELPSPRKRVGLRLIYAQWIYPFTSTIDSPNPLPGVPGDKPVMSIMRGSCPDYVPHIEGAEAFDKYGNGGGIEVSRLKEG